jgi:hypothetical protein
MKKITLAFIGFLLIGGASIQAQEKKASPAMTAEGKVGETNITIEYSSPSVKDRAIYGELVPFGEIWRAGANEATTIAFDKTVMVNGQKLVAGKYAFFVTPNENEPWTLIFNSVPKQWGAYKHDASKDVLVTESTTSEIDMTEKLTYSVEDGMVHLDWATTRVSFSVK